VAIFAIILRRRIAYLANGRCRPTRNYEILYGLFTDRLPQLIMMTLDVAICCCCCCCFFLALDHRQKGQRPSRNWLPRTAGSSARKVGL